MDGNQAAIEGKLQDALGQITRKQLGEQRENVEAHGSLRRENYAVGAGAAAGVSASGFGQNFLMSTATLSDVNAPTLCQYLMRSALSVTRLSLSFTIGS